MEFSIEKEFCQICNSPLMVENTNNYACSKAPHYFIGHSQENNQKEIKTTLFIINSLYILFEDRYQNDIIERTIIIYNNYYQIYKVNCCDNLLSIKDVLNIVKFL